MSTFIGRQIDFGIAVESVRGTAETTATKWVRKTIADVIPRSERVIDDTTFGRLEDAERTRSVRKWNEGSLEGILHVDVAGYIFLNLYGTVNTQAEGASYLHTFTLLQEIQHPSLTLFVKDSDVRNTKIAGATVSSFEMTATTDDYVRFTAEFIGKEEEVSAATPSLDTEFDFVSRDIEVVIADTENDLDTAEPLKLKNLTVTWSPNAIADYVVGSYSPDDIYNGSFGIEVSFTRNYTDQIFEILYKSDDAKYMRISLVGEAELTNGGENPTIILTLNKAQVQDWSRSSAGDELSTEEVTIKAFYNPTDQAQSTVEIINNVTNYAVAS